MKAISPNDIEPLTDIDWFDQMCSILEKEKHPSTHQLILTIGIEDSMFKIGNRGSKFLKPFDKRFKWACINPDITYSDPDQPLDYLSFAGTDFNLKIVDVIRRFPNYKTHRNIYDGGTQIFFYPVPEQYEFAACSFQFDAELKDISNITTLILHHVAFHFGNIVILGRDGYHVCR